jgi:flagellar hook-length control protein FliK
VPWQPDLPVDTTALLAQAAQWNAVPAVSPEQPNPKAATGMPANLFGAAKSALGVDKPEGTALASAALGEVVSELAGKAGKVQKDAVARLAAAQAALVEPAVTSNSAADARQAQVLQKIADTPPNPISTALTAAIATVTTRREDVGRERSVFRSTASDAASPVQTYVPSASNASFVNAPAPVTSTETYVAEKVAYWISNDVQNAEMKLDGIGELPVEVSIRMQGNEAHIAFRSDELQAREALENASLHLKEMLQREGLVLSGVSVGMAGAGDGGTQDRKSRQGARQSGMVSVQPASTEGVAGSRRSTGGALDLFV